MKKPLCTNSEPAVSVGLEKDGDVPAAFSALIAEKTASRLARSCDGLLAEKKSPALDSAARNVSLMRLPDGVTVWLQGVRRFESSAVSCTLSSS